MKRLLIIFAVTLFVCTAALGAVVEHRSAYDLKTRIEGNSDKVTMMVFFATWCPPCRAEIPALIRIYDDYFAKGLDLFAVSLDNKSPEEMERFIASQGINYPVFLGNENVARTYRVQSIPTIFLYKRGGIQSEMLVGAHEEKDLRAKIEELLK